MKPEIKMRTPITGIYNIEDLTYVMTGKVINVDFRF